MTIEGGYSFEELDKLAKFLGSPVNLDGDTRRTRYEETFLREIEQLEEASTFLPGRFWSPDPKKLKDIQRLATRLARTSQELVVAIGGLGRDDTQAILHHQRLDVLHLNDVVSPSMQGITDRIGKLLKRQASNNAGVNSRSLRLEEYEKLFLVACWIFKKYKGYGPVAQPSHSKAESQTEGYTPEYDQTLKFFKLLIRPFMKKLPTDMTLAYHLRSKIIPKSGIPKRFRNR